MSPRSSKEKSADPDIYVGLLFIAAASLLTGCIFLIMELNKYDWMMGPQ